MRKKNNVKTLRRNEGADKAIKEAIEQIAHDMSGPLSFVAQYVRELSAPQASGGCSEDEIYAAAMRSLERVICCVDGLKNVALEYEPVFGHHDFADVIRSAIVEATPSAETKGVQISYAGIDHLVGKFDRAKVFRVIANLISNSLGATGCGGDITITLMNSGKSVWVEVSDTGAGIADGLDDKIFERGFTSGKPRGTGLGLHYCREVMSMHGGSIGAYEREGSGTVFALSFPMSAVFAAEVFEDSNQRTLKAILLDEAGDELTNCISPICETCSSIHLSDESEFRGIPSDEEITLDP